MLTNQTTKKFVEPRLLIVTDPRTDYNAILESSYVNIPVIAICNTDNNLKYVDCAIPCNNRSVKAVSMIWYLWTKAVLEVKKDTENFEKNPSAYVNPDLVANKKGEGRKGKEEEGEEDKEEGGEGGEEGEEGDDNKEEDGGEDEGDEDDGDEKFVE